MRVDQFIPAFHHGDAIGDSGLHLKEFLCSQGFSSEIYCLDRDKGLEKKSVLYADYPQPGPEDVNILHFALPSPLSKAFIEIPGRKILIHHNITPPEFFSGFSEEMVRISEAGRREFESLVPHVDLALADSEYNRQELSQCGFSNTAVFPLFVDLSKYERPHNRFVHDLFRDDRTNILFVGRIVPNKKIENLIKVLFYYKKFISPLVRLIVIGKTESLPSYYQSLVRLADEFYLKPEEICFTGHIPDEEMYALYRASDVFLSMSEHEGFGLPFIESMVFDLPVMAFNCTAVPYTLDGAGILFNTRQVDRVSELVDIVVRDQNLRKKVINGQRERLKRFDPENRERLFLRFIEDLTG
ncbi:MAG: glycosyltransferase [Candidatus Aminicenantes bacterium]|nr:glycosyltransferase [Candidatus Aminicenantes bacterium]